MYYAVLAMAEILGRSNQSQVIDLGVNDGELSTPGYAIYENGTPMRSLSSITSTMLPVPTT
jgi:hypothetical protein